MNTLGYAILGLVALEPRTGYEVAQKMKAPIGYMWTARHSQIYTELARLTESGYLDATVLKGRGPHDIKRYSITAPGRRELSSWVDAPLVENTRNELALRVRSLWLISPGRARAFIACQRQWHVDRLATYRDDELKFAADLDHLDDPTSPAFGVYSTLRYGMNRMQMTIDWLDWLRERIDGHLARRAPEDAVGDTSAEHHPTSS